MRRRSIAYGECIDTAFPRPPAPLVDRLVQLALRAAGDHDEAAPHLVESGASSLIALTERTAVRLTRRPGDAGEVLRTQRLVDRLPQLPFDVPRSRGDAVHLDGYTAVPMQRLHGTPHPAGTGDPGALRELLGAIRSIAPDPIREHLAPARAFCGGESWQEVLRDRVVPLLPDDVRAAALTRIDALASLRSPGRTVTHGDLAGANVLWRDGRVSGVLDWELAAMDDPAEDLAALTVWHGVPLAPQLADEDTVRRAAVFRATFPLQVVAFAVLHDDPAEAVASVASRAADRLRADAAQ